MCYEFHKLDSYKFVTVMCYEFSQTIPADHTFLLVQFPGVFSIIAAHMGMTAHGFLRAKDDSARTSTISAGAHRLPSRFCIPQSIDQHQRY